MLADSRPGCAARRLVESGLARLNTPEDNDFSHDINKEEPE